MVIIRYIPINKYAKEPEVHYLTTDTNNWASYVRAMREMNWTVLAVTF